MAEYIEREVFLEQKREQYCKDCTSRKGMRNGKYKTLYEIGEAPCRACGINDVLNDVEDFPAADVRPVKKGRWIRHYEQADTGEDIIAYPCGWVCSECGRWESDDEPFCNCGAEMEAGE